MMGYCSNAPNPMISAARTRLSHPRTHHQKVSPFFLGSILVSISLLTPLAKTYAQVAPITPSDLSTQVSGPIAVGGQTQYDITGGTRPGGGTNLFHSFGTFGVPPDNIANFLNGVSFDLAGNPLTAGLSTSNILARVTGNIRSDIYGTIQTTGFENANLFLMNPAGFLFGPNATVNVGGMVAFTSTDYLKLTGDARFNAIPNSAADALLTALPIASFGFLGSNPGAITVQGSQFSVTDGQSISLVGGDIIIGADPETGTPATLMAPSGEIHLASVASPGEVLLPNLQTGPNINGQSVTTMGNVSLIEGAILDASGSPTEGTGAGGTIRIRAGQFVMDNAVLYSATQGEVDGATAAVDINVTGDVSLNNVSTAASEGFGTGRSGDINIRANNVLVETVSFVSTGAAGDGQAGNIAITATDTLSVKGTDGEGNFSSIESVTSGSNRSVRAGDSGDITINAAAVSLDEGGFIRTRTESDGTARDITLEANNVHLAGGGFIETRSEGDGSTGAIIVTATETVTLVGAEHLSQIAQTQIGNRQDGTGSTGGISVTATEFLMTDSAQIFNDSGSATGGVTVTAHNAITLSGSSEISSRTVGEEVGPITLSAPTITLTDQAVLRASTTGSGNAGAISLTGETISLSNQSFLTSRTISSGEGGEITIDATNTVLLSGGAIITTSSLNPATGSAGLINITADNAVFLSGADTMILSETAGSGDGGVITVQTNQAQITDGAVISATSTGSGAAGSVTIEGNSPAQSVFIDGSGSGLFTDTQGTGAGGNIFVNADSVTLQNGGTLSAKTSGTEVTATGGTITVHAYQVNTDGATITVETTGAGQAGSIALITQPTAELTADAISLNNSLVSSSTSSNANAGDILLQTGTLRIENSQISSDAIPLEGLIGGNAGTIQAQVGGDITLTNSVVSTSTAGNGNAGNILMASNSLQAESTLLASTAAAFPGLSGGNGGTIHLDINQDVHLSNSTIDSQTGANGDAGNVFLNATSLTLNSSSLSTGTSPGEGFTGGNAGDIQVTVGQLTMNDGLIVSQSLFSAGNGGMVTVTASESITTSGSGIFPFAISTSTDGAAPFCPGTCGDGGSINLMAPTVVLNGVGLNSTTTGQGNAGSILTRVGTLTVMNGAQISASAENPGVVTGAGGTITVQGTNSPAQSVLIDGAGSGIFTTTEGTGIGGNINILVGQSVTMTNGSRISASSTGAGNAGNIQINAGQTFLATNSTVTTQANLASGGAIKITTTPSGTVQLTNSTISASVLDGTGGGGSVDIDPQFVILLNSQILAQAVQGPGGNIFITTNFLLPDANSVISASSQFGVNGTVTIQSPNAPGSGQIQPLGKSPLLATSLLNQRCAALAGGEFSSFTVAGRDSLPTEPSGWLSSPLYAAGVGLGIKAEGVKAEGERLETPLLSLRQIAPAGFLTQAFAVDWSAGCQS